MSETSLQLFVSCLPGLEPLLAEELVGLGLPAPRIEGGGVLLDGSLRDVYRANLESGLASHVLARLGAFRARGLGEVVRRSAALPWANWVRPGQPVQMRVSSSRSRLYHTGAIEQRVRQGMATALGGKPEKGTGAAGDAVVQVRFLQDQCTVSVDTSGDPLHRRGWRLASAKAPVREDLARALVVASGWDPTSPLLDPFVGSGTIVIEAAAMARRLPPGRGRRFAFEDAAGFDAELWRSVCDAADAASLPEAPSAIVGSDRNAGAVEAARANAERAGVASDLLLRHAALMDAPYLCGDPEPGAAGWIVTNPPFGKRVGRAPSLRPLYQSLGKCVRKLAGGWRVTMLSNDRRLTLSSGIPMDTGFLTRHGGLKVRALCSVAVSDSAPSVAEE